MPACFSKISDLVFYMSKEDLRSLSRILDVLGF